MAGIDPGTAGDDDPRLIRPYIGPPATPGSSPQVPEGSSPLVPGAHAARPRGTPAGELDADGAPLYGRTPEADLLRRRRERQQLVAAIAGEPLDSPEPNAAPGGTGGWAGLRSALLPGGDRRRARLLVIVAGAVILLLVFGIGAFRLQDGVTSNPVLPDALPPARTPSGATAGPTDTGGPPPVSVVPGDGGAVLPGAGAGTTRPGNPAPPTFRLTVSPTKAKSPPSTTSPSVPVGAIRGAGGRCLDVIGGVEAKGHRLQVLNCNGAVSQTWSLTSANTLTVGNLCAESTSSGAVKAVACDGSSAGVWRVGSGSSLVNAKTGDCLNDPSAGTANAVEVGIADCDGGNGQRWSLP